MQENIRWRKEKMVEDNPKMIELEEMKGFCDRFEDIYLGTYDAIYVDIQILVYG